MTGKLKIIRVLSNPAPRRRKKKKALQRSRKRLRRKTTLRGASPKSARYVVRVVGRDKGAAWWTGKSWSPLQSRAHKYRGAPAAQTAMKKARGKIGRQDWVVIDALPA